MVEEKEGKKSGQVKEKGCCSQQKKTKRENKLNNSSKK